MYGHNFNRSTSKVNIQRITTAEPDKAIADLEKRGYELVHREDDEEFDHKAYNVPKDKYDRVSFGGSHVHRKCRAEMRRKVVEV